jgi:hypothetical protein
LKRDVSNLKPYQMGLTDDTEEVFVKGPTNLIQLGKQVDIDSIKIGLDQISQQLANGNGVLVFNTLTDLQNAYPTGSTQPAFVLADKKFYYWDNGSVFTLPTNQVITSAFPVDKIYASSGETTDTSGFTWFTEYFNPSDWTVVGGRLHNSAIPNSSAGIIGVDLSASWTNKHVRADCIMGGGTSNYGGICLENGSYVNTIMMRGDSGTSLKLFTKVNDGAWTLVATYPKTFIDGQVIQMRLSLINNQVLAYADGVLLGTYALTTAEQAVFTDVRRGGLFTKSSAMYFDNFYLEGNALNNPTN